MPKTDQSRTVERNGHEPLNAVLRRVLRRGAAVSPKNPRKEKSRTATVPAKVKGQPAKGLVTGRISDVRPVKVKFLWRNRIPRGKLTIVQGDPGNGKTTVALDMASHVTTGQPYCDGATCQIGEVLFVTAEDGIADTIRPRLDLLGADCSRVHYLEHVHDAAGQDKALDLDKHLKFVDAWLADHPDVCLVVFDPLAAFLGKEVDSHRNADVRGLLGRLAKLAEARDVALVAINHLNKTMMKVIHRSVGSIAFVAAARAVWQVSADSDDADRRLFLPVKMNLCKASGLAFKITDKGITWEPGRVTITADEAEAEAGETPRAEAKAWILGLLKGGPKPAKLIEKKAREDGICMRTLKYAKRELGIESVRHAGEWSWRLCKSAKR